MGWWNTGIKTNNIRVIGNKFMNSKAAGIYSGLSADSISIKNNYIENAPVGIVKDANVTNYIEFDNTVISNDPFGGRAVDSSNTVLSSQIVKQKCFVM